VGSGLILLVIVGAWLAVLVPMALRSHDASNSLGGVDKFHDAMRVLSRRTGAATGAEDEAGAAAEDVAPPAAAPRSAPRSLAARRAAAARRRRLLLVLLALCALTLVGAVLGPRWALAPHLVVDLLLVAFVVQLRRTALRRAERDLQAAMRERPAQAATPPAAAPAAPAAPAASCAVRQAAHVAGIPSRMPPRPAPLDAPAAAPAASYEAPPAARGAQGEAWSPVPVPAPTYLSAPTAPRRSVDLTRASASADGLADAERELGIVDEGPQLDEILDRRRAVNDW
jgi:hypothetical protein